MDNATNPPTGKTAMGDRLSYGEQFRRFNDEVQQLFQTALSANKNDPETLFE